MHRQAYGFSSRHDWAATADIPPELADCGLRFCRFPATGTCQNLVTGLTRGMQSHVNHAWPFSLLDSRPVAAGAANGSMIGTARGSVE